MSDEGGNVLSSDLAAVAVFVGFQLGRTCDRFDGDKYPVALSRREIAARIGIAMASFLVGYVVGHAATERESGGIVCGLIAVEGTAALVGERSERKPAPEAAPTVSSSPAPVAQEHAVTRSDADDSRVILESPGNTGRAAL